MEAVTIAPRGRTLVAMITCSRLLALAALLTLLHSFSCAATETEPAEDAHVLVPGSPSVVVETAVELEFDQEHALWTRVLQRFVRDDEFDYGGLQRDQDGLSAYLKQLHADSLEQLAKWTAEQRYAFWVNAYNAHTIQLVVGNYPLASIRKLDRALGLKSVFDKEFIPMKAHHPDGADDELSLNDIENEILRKKFKDARVHAAINCASVSCPPLRNEAFTASKLEAQLDGQMRAFVNDPDRNKIDAEQDQLQISEIFKWFKEDFERDSGSVREFLLRFAPDGDAELIREAKLRYIDYDWDLNDTRKES
jgi:hypothetical protein